MLSTQTDSDRERLLKLLAAEKAKGILSSQHDVSSRSAFTEPRLQGRDHGAEEPAGAGVASIGPRRPGAMNHDSGANHEAMTLLAGMLPFLQINRVTRAYRAHVLAALTKPLARRPCRLRPPPPSPAPCRACGGRARRSHRPALASPQYW
jgi:hypothetical protein